MDIRLPENVTLCFQHRCPGAHRHIYHGLGQLPDGTMVCWTWNADPKLDELYDVVARGATDAYAARKELYDTCFHGT